MEAIVDTTTLSKSPTEVLHSVDYITTALNSRSNISFPLNGADALPILCLIESKLEAPADLSQRLIRQVFNTISNKTSEVSANLQLIFRKIDKETTFLSLRETIADYSFREYGVLNDLGIPQIISSQKITNDIFITEIPTKVFRESRKELKQKESNGIGTETRTRRSKKRISN